MKIPFKQIYCCLLTIVMVCMLLLNISIQNNIYIGLHQSYHTLENGIRITENGTMKLKLASLLLPAARLINDFSKLPVINGHTYNFINQPKNVCTNKSLDLLIAIVSSVINFDRRQIARKTREILPLMRIVYLFFLGRSLNMTVKQKGVDLEASQYDDIVQEDFEDSERNLSLKSVSILRWVNDYCPNVKYVVKIDDDIRLNIKTALESLDHKNKTHQHFVMGNSKYLVEGPIRDKLSKYYTSVLEYKEAFFPTFVHGPAYGFPGKTAILLYQIAIRTQLFWLEDVYITGICTQRANIPVFFDNGFTYKHDSFDLF